MLPTQRHFNKVRLLRASICFALAFLSAPIAAREVVDASPASDVAVTIYRGTDGSFNRNNPRGFAMISETRTVTLPDGESTIRFEGVAEGMIAVSAIVSGLPGGTIEKNRNADLLSPAALVDGTLGNRVTITRTNPATGLEESELAIVRTRADGGIVLQTSAGYEAVRCSGLPERLSFDAIPDGLSAQPVFSIDTRDDTGGTYQVTLTYLSWGFDWQANYITTLKDGGRRGRQDARMLSWLTLVNDNGQSFEDAELLVVAGTLNVESDFEELAEPPRADPLRLTCWPRGNTARGTINRPLPPPPPPPMSPDAIVVTAARLSQESVNVADLISSLPAVLAGEENLGDLKLFRVPEPITIRAKGLKQVAFLNKDNVRGELIYEAVCSVDNSYREYLPSDTRQIIVVGEIRDSQLVQSNVSPSGYGFSRAQLIFQTENDEKHGLGASLPRGGVAVFEPSPYGQLLIGEDEIRDYPVGQEVEIDIAESTKVFSQCVRTGEVEEAGGDEQEWEELRATLTNSGSQSAEVRLEIGNAAQYEVRRVRGLKLRNGMHVIELKMKPGEEREVRFWVRSIY